MNNTLIAFIRTLTPIVVGYVISILLEWGIDLSNKPQTVNIITVGLIIVWYVVFHFAEKKWPSLGWFLGYAQAPSYDEPGSYIAKHADTPSDLQVSAVVDSKGSDSPA